MQKAPANCEGLFSYFSLFPNSWIWIFCDEDLIRSSSLKKSAVSSAIVLGGGLGGKGSTSDMVGPPCGYTSARHLDGPSNGCIYAAQVFAPARNPPSLAPNLSTA